MPNAAPDSFAVRLGPHQRSVLALCQRMLGPADGPDAAQEALLKAYLHLPEQRDDGALRAWTLSIARRTCLDQLRRRGREPQPLAAELESSAVTAGPESEAPDVVVARAQDAARLSQALQTLPERYREPLLLFHQEELGYREIAEVLQVPIGTVMTWLFRGRQALRKALEASPELNASEVER